MPEPPSATQRERLDPSIPAILSAKSPCPNVSSTSNVVDPKTIGYQPAAERVLGRETCEIQAAKASEEPRGYTSVCVTVTSLKGMEVNAQGKNEDYDTCATKGTKRKMDAKRSMEDEQTKKKPRRLINTGDLHGKGAREPYQDMGEKQPRDAFEDYCHVLSGLEEQNRRRQEKKALNERGTR